MNRRFSALKSLVILCLAITLVPALNAQKIDISWSDNSRIKFDYDDAVQLRDGNYIVLKQDGGMKVFGFGGKPNPTLVLTDKNMEVTKEFRIEMDGKRNSVKGLKKYGNNVFFMYEAYESRTTTVYALKINEKTLLPSSPITLGSFDSDSYGDQAETEYQLSPDSSKILIFTEGPDRKKENKKFFINVLNTDLKTIWKKDIELPYGDRYISVYDQDLLNDGRVVVAIKHYDKEVLRQAVREDGDKIPSYKYKLLVYKPAAAVAQEIPFNLENNFIQGTKLVYSTNGTITAAGLYKQKSNGRITGLFYGTLQESTFELNNTKIIPFPSDLVAIVDKDGFAKDKGGDIGLYQSFKVNHVLARKNGSVDLISEYSKVVTHTSTNSSGFTETITYYYSGDIIVANLDKDGKATFTRIPKDIVLRDFNLGLGYYPVIYGEKLLLFYNDNLANLERDLAKAPDDMRRFKRAAFAVATIDEKGGLTRRPIYNYRDEEYLAHPKKISKISDTQYLLTSYLLKMFKKRTRFGVMEIK